MLRYAFKNLHDNQLSYLHHILVFFDVNKKKKKGMENTFTFWCVEIFISVVSKKNITIGGSLKFFLLFKGYISVCF